MYRLTFVDSGLFTLGNGGRNIQDMSGVEYTIVERDGTGRTRRIYLSDSQVLSSSDSTRPLNLNQALEFTKKVFLPSGYPQSVSSGAQSYSSCGSLRFEVFFLDAVQIIFTQLLSSRAILEGFGVGDPSATATHALLLTVLQDVCGRLTTIYGAYTFGSSLVPEAKTYRLLADALNDASIILSTISPLLSSHSIPGLRVGVLCLSASFSALCGIAAGGSKAAITLHFASPIGGTGDVGDLNAKDSSKETVLSLLGMLLGTLVVPRLVTAWATYTALFLLVGLHLSINYLGVRGLILRTLNRQRVALAWSSYRSSNNATVPSPAEVSAAERILTHPGVFRDTHSGQVTGTCTFGLSFFDAFPGHFPSHLFELFKEEKYLLWYDHQCLQPTRDVEGYTIRGLVRLHIVLKDGYTLNDQLKAWIHAAELCSMTAREHREAGPKNSSHHDGEALALIRSSHQQTVRYFQDFLARMRAASWNTTDSVLMPGSPKGVLMRVNSGRVEDGDDRGEEKKIR